MIVSSEQTRVYLALGATDMRKQIDGLAVLVEDVLEQDPFSDCLFVFCNRTRDKQGDTIRARTDDYGHALYYRDNDFDILDRVIEIARKHECKPIQIALAWMLHKPGITSPIIGASKTHHLDDAVAALEIKLSADDMAYLEELNQPHPILGHV